MFTRQISTAKRLIQKNGQLVQWKQTIKDVDDDKPWEQVETTAVSNDVYICFLSSTDPWLRYIKGADVPLGGIYGLMGQVDFNLSVADVVIRDGQEMRIKEIDSFAPNGEMILNTIEFVR